MKSVVIAKERADGTVSAKVLLRAVARGRSSHRPGPQARELRYIKDLRALLIGFADKSAVLLPIRKYRELARLDRGELEQLKLGFAGRALCLDSRDLHVSIAGLLAASEDLMNMAKTVVAIKNGSRVSQAKAAASRENGKKGGRPRKITTLAR
jgi:hypothetical protein